MAKISISDKDLLEALKNDPELLKQVQASAKEAKKGKDNSKRYDKNGKVLKDGEREKGKGYEFRWYDQNGKRYSKYADDLDTLRRKERQIQKDLEEGIITNEADSITIGMVWNKFIQKKEKSGMAIKTINQYYSTYNNHIIKLKDKKVRSFHYSDIVDYYHHIVEEKNCSYSTIVKIHSMLSMFFDMCIKDQYITVNPCNGALSEIKDSCKKPEKKEALTIDQQNKLIEFLANDDVYNRWCAFVTVALTTGMRVSELCGLTWERVDFEKNEIHVEYQLQYVQEKNKGSYNWHVGDLKTDNSNRIIPMLTETKIALMKEKEFQNELGLKSASFTDVVNHEKVTLSNFVFLNENGNPYDYHGINKALKRIIKAYNKQECEKAEAENRDPVLIDPIGSHIFRHTYSTRMAEMDVNMKVLQSVMGHADIKTTMNIYTDAQPQKIHEEFEKVDQKYRLS